MINNSSQSGERRYSREDMACGATRKYVVDVAATYVRDNFPTHFPTMFAQAPTGEIQMKPAATLDPHFASGAVAEVAITPAAVEEERQLTEFELKLAAQRAAVEEARENPNEAAA